jgi:hypothetical protein
MFTARARRWAATILTAGLAVGGIATAGPAFAGTAGGGGGGGGHHQHFKPQVFKLELNSDNQAAGGVVRAFGPIRGTGTDKQVNDNLDVFTFPRGSVNVAHWAKAHKGPKIDSRSCTAFYFENGKWKIKGGTDKYRHAEGSGQYKLITFVVLKRLGHNGKVSQSATDHKHGRCDTNMNDEPEYFETTVFATGVSSLGKHGHGD